jgi:hypothetical protein
MASARPLRDVFADLVGDPDAAGDPAAFLRDQGHPGLPDHLVAEAVVSYADTAPVEVAEHLAPYVTAHSAVGAGPASGDEPPAGWADLLGTAPDVSGPADLDDLGSVDSGEAAGLDPEPGLDLDFGAGAGPLPGGATEDGAEIPADEPADLGDGADDLSGPAGSGDVADWMAVEPAVELADEDDAGPDDDVPLG